MLIRRRKKGRWGDPFLTYVSMQEAQSNAENSPATEKALDQVFVKKILTIKDEMNSISANCGYSRAAAAFTAAAVGIFFVRKYL